MTSYYVTQRAGNLKDLYWRHIFSLCISALLIHLMKFWSLFGFLFLLCLNSISKCHPSLPHSRYTFCHIAHYVRQGGFSVHSEYQRVSFEMSSLATASTASALMCSCTSSLRCSYSHVSRLLIGSSLFKWRVCICVSVCLCLCVCVRLTADLTPPAGAAFAALMHIQSVHLLFSSPSGHTEPLPSTDLRRAFAATSAL